jgi:hypothetical protein
MTRRRNAILDGRSVARAAQTRVLPATLRPSSRLVIQAARGQADGSPVIPLLPRADRANGQPAFGTYLRAPGGISHGTGLYVLTLTGDRICAMTRFENSVLPSFGLPRSLPGS